MKEIQNVNQWKTSVLPFLESKVEEFHLMGYNQATTEDIWNCLVEKVWKGEPELRIYKVVRDIMHLQSSIYLSYLTTKSLQDDDLMTSIAALLENE